MVITVNQSYLNECKTVIWKTTGIVNPIVCCTVSITTPINWVNCELRSIISNIIEVV